MRTMEARFKFLSFFSSSLSIVIRLYLSISPLNELTLSEIFSYEQIIGNFIFFVCCYQTLGVRESGEGAVWKLQADKCVKRNFT